MEYDSAVGIYYDHARYYDAAIGRFVSQDPMGFTAGDTDLYRYVKNSTTTAVDPSGDEFITMLLFGGLCLACICVAGCGGAGEIYETFKNPADAIGDLNGHARLVSRGPTKNEFWLRRGFFDTEYYLDSNGQKWTVFKNPWTGEYSGGHHSSPQ